MLVAFALLCGGIFIIADFGTLLRPKKTCHFSFDSIQGLRQSDDVMYAGIKCGRVTGIAFKPCPGTDSNVGMSKTRVLVTVEIDADVPLRDRDKPKITRGLTGNVYMDIVPYRGETDKDPLGDLVGQTTPDNALMGYHYPSFGELGEEAKGVLRQMRRELARVGRALDDIEKAAENVKNLTGDARNLFARNEKKVDPILDNARKITEDVKEVTAELKPEALATIADIRATVKEARTKIETMLGKMNGIVDKLDVAADDVRVATADARAATGDARQVASEARELVVANRPNIDGTIEEMRQMAARLNLAMEDIRRNPWKLLNRNIDADAYTQNIYDAALSFAEGARALSMASANLESLLSRKDADPRLVRESADNVNKLVTQMARLEKLLYEAMKKRP